MVSVQQHSVRVSDSPLFQQSEECLAVYTSEEEMSGRSRDDIFSNAKVINKVSINVKVNVWVECHRIS